MQPPKKRQIKIALPKDDPSAAYANTVMISHTTNEVIFDFLQVMPNDTHGRIQKRIVMTPVHAKLFLKALGENIERHEEKHGEIKIPERMTLADQLFKGMSPNEGDNDNDSGGDDA